MVSKGTASIRRFAFRGGIAILLIMLVLTVDPRALHGQSDQQEGESRLPAADLKSDPPSDPGASPADASSADAVGDDAGSGEWMRFGSFRYHKPTRALELDGRFNLSRGPVEFLICAPSVKAHETIIAVPGDPELMNLALLLQGLTPRAERRPRSDVDLEFIPGDRVVIELRFSKPGEDGEPVETLVRAEDAVLNRLTGEPMRRVGFVYTGSEHIPVDPDEPNGEKAYAPSIVGFYVALVHRRLAILDNPLELPYPDPEYAANPAVIPRPTAESSVPVTVIIRPPREGEIDLETVRMPILPRRAEEPSEDSESSPEAGDATPGEEAPDPGSPVGSGRDGR